MTPRRSMREAVRLLEAAPLDRLAPPGHSTGPHGQCCPILYLTRAWSEAFADYGNVCRAGWYVAAELGLTDEDVTDLIRTYDEGPGDRRRRSKQVAKAAVIEALRGIAQRKGQTP